MPFQYKTALRGVLGVTLYRVITQFPRYVRFLTKPRREKEIALLPLLISADDYCFDIGANYGQYAREISPLLKGGRVFSFEPSRINCIGLKTTVRLLGLKNVSVFTVALADTERKETLHIPVKAHGGLGIATAHLGQPLRNRAVTETVAVTTLDAFMRAHNIVRCDFIKCDAEGSEFSILTGAKETIASCRPLMQMEVSSDYLRRLHHSPHDIGAFIHALNYRAFVWRDGKLAPVDGDVMDCRNNFFVPEEKLARFTAAFAQSPVEWKQVS